MSAPVAENRTRLKDANGAELIVPEKSTGPRITLTLVDETGAAVPLAAITTATLTLYARDEASLPIINSVDHLNIKNDGVRGTIHATSGLLTLLLQPNDNAIVNSANDLEWHRLLLEINYSGTQYLRHELEVPVRNLNKVS